MPNFFPFIISKTYLNLASNPSCEESVHSGDFLFVRTVLHILSESMRISSISPLLGLKIATASEEPSEILGDSESRNYCQFSFISWALNTLTGFLRNPNWRLMLKAIGKRMLQSPERMSLSFGVSLAISCFTRSWFSSGKLLSSRVSSSGYSTGLSTSICSCTGSGDFSSVFYGLCSKEASCISTSSICEF